VFGDFGVVYNVDDGNTFIGVQAFFNGTFSFSVPAGNYQVSTLISDGTDGSYAFVTSEVAVRTNNTVVVLDAKKATRVGVTAPDGAMPVVETVTLQRNAAQGPSFTDSLTSFGPTPVYASPSRPVTVGQRYFYPSYRLGDAAGRLDRVVYDLQFAYIGGIPDNLERTVARADLAEFDVTYHSSSPARAQLDGRIALAPWQANVGFSTTAVTAPSIRKEYVLPQPDTRWLQVVVLDPQQFAGFGNDQWRSPAAGDHTAVEWTAQPQPPGTQRPDDAQPCPACRAGDTLSTMFFPFVDPAGNAMTPDPGMAVSVSLYRGGKPIGKPQDSGFASFTLDPDEGTYQLAMDVSRDAGWWPSSTQTHTVWTFSSAPRAPDQLPDGWTCGGKGGGGGGGKGAPAGKGDGCSFERFLFASYDTHAGADDVVPAGGSATIDVTVRRHPMAPAAAIESLLFDVSFDDGASWTAAAIVALGDGRFRASYPQPALDKTTGFASLRLAAADVEGSVLEQTITRAYPLAVPPPPAPGGGGGGGRPAFRPCNVAVMAPYAQCMAMVKPASDRGTPPPAPDGYAPADIAGAYRLPPGAGAGRTVAIVDAYDNPLAEADLVEYREKYKLPPCTSENGCFRKVNQRGAAGPLPAANKGWGLEISLDLDAVSATCPSCNILLVEADSPSLFDLARAVETAVALGADAISNSYGSRGEFSGVEYFERFYKHSGVAITASSGDYGYGNGVPLIASVSYPGSSEFVTSVGGTTLRRDGSERGWTETAWAGSTSGCSAYIHKPGWQKDRLCAKRTVADVAAVADPDTGLAVLDNFGYGGWLVVGGTSLSSPIIASIYAMAGHTQDVRYGVVPYRAAPSAFFDVVGGDNGSCSGTYLCKGVPGYDGPTGLGTPNGLGGF
jgi:hypothetical protein